MKNLNKIALAADLTEMDEMMLHFIKGYDSLFDFEELHLIHQIEIEELSPEFEAMLAQKNQSLEELIREELQSKIDSVFGENKSTIHIYIQPQPDFSALVNWINKSKFDLFFLGKKKGLEGSGIFSSKMVRLLRCNLILVPETAKPTITKTIVPIDFSSYTGKVLEMSGHISKTTGTELLPIHILKIGIHYFPFVGNEKSIRKSLEKEALGKYEKLKKKANIEASLSMYLAEGYSIGNAIYKHTRELKGDLIVISKKGKSDDSDLLLGSVAENLIANDKNVTVLIIQ
ncbi:MAG: universal stress protein [Bacteroidota bacterium]